MKKRLIFAPPLLLCIGWISFWADHSLEMQNAYRYAYDVGATTQESIDNANMYWTMTRAEMAKILGAWAERVIGIEADTSKLCTFTDTSSIKGDLADWIIKSCQMGLMGVGITEFRPYDTVSRAEFGTVLSRAIWGTRNDGATPYYIQHLQALQKEGIMNNIDEPEEKELRGYVMLMIQRSWVKGNIGIDTIQNPYQNEQRDTEWKEINESWVTTTGAEQSTKTSWWGWWGWGGGSSTKTEKCTFNSGKFNTCILQ